MNAGGSRFRMHGVTYGALDTYKRKHMEVNAAILVIYEHLMAELRAYYQVEAPELLADEV
jgi:hypothetical protein